MCNTYIVEQAVRIASMYMSLGLPMSRVVQLLLDDNQTVGDALKKLESEPITARFINL
jgi:hypothetical protein